MRSTNGDFLAAADQRYVLDVANQTNALLRNGGQSIISGGGDNGFGTNTQSGTGAIGMWGYRIPMVARLTSGTMATNLRALFDSRCVSGQTANQAGFSSGEAPCGPFWIKIAFQKQGPTGPNDQTSSHVPAFFNGKRWVRLDMLSNAWSDPLDFPVANGERYFVLITQAGGLSNAPAAPVLTPSPSGGTMAAGTYYVVITHMSQQQADGFPNETCRSDSTTTTTLTGTLSSVSVAAPTAVNGCLGYRVYISLTNSSVGPFYLVSGVNPVPYGTAFVITSIPSNRFRQQPPYDVPLTQPLNQTIEASATPTGAAYTFATTLTADFTDGNTFGNQTWQPLYGPIAVTGQVLNSTGAPVAQKGVVAIGDSINWGYGDGNHRATLGGLAICGCELNGIPALTVSRGSETAAAYADPAGRYNRSRTAAFASTVVCNYGTNDLGVSTLAKLKFDLLRIGVPIVAGGQRLIQTTILPRTTGGNANAYRTVAAQTTSGFESVRVPLNTWIRSGSSTGTVVTNEAMGTGNASNKAFEAADVFVAGGEVVRVAGVTKVYGTDYYYTLGPIGLYAYGITFLSAPANGAAVTISYTSAPGWAVAVGNPAEAFPWDICVPVEVNSSNVLTQNGGFWRAGGSIVTTGLFTGHTLHSGLQYGNYTDSGANFGVLTPGVVKLSADGGAGSILSIASNDATNIWVDVDVTTNPNYTVYTGTYALDGVHPTTLGYNTIAATFPASLVR